MTNKKLMPKHTLVGYDTLKSFQQGGSVTTSEDKRQELFPYFAYFYSRELDPKKYGAATSIEEWTELIQDSQEDIDAITAAASELSDEDWDNLERQYAQAQKGGGETTEESPSKMQIPSTKKGAQLQKLKEYAKGSAIKKANKEVTKSISNPDITKGAKGTKAKKMKKCECGCAKVLTKSAGGQLTSVCACKCGGKMKKAKKK
ncbi:MAG: hypothetical protein ACOH2V_00250 [Candidatus Saccharimonadaceae bacterium]